MKKLNKKIIFGLFSILDLIIIISIICFLGICYKFMRGGNNNSINNTITYVVEVVEIEQNLIDNISVGDILFDVKSNNEVGEITNIEISSSYRYTYDYHNKVYKKIELKDKNNLYVEIKSDVYETESNLLIGNLDIKAGTEISLKGKGYYIIGKVYSINR